jgi:hypothetical protein
MQRYRASLQALYNGVNGRSLYGAPLLRSAVCEGALVVYSAMAWDQ